VHVSNSGARQRAGKKSREQEPSKPPRDPSGKWKRKVVELALKRGWSAEALWRRFDEFACIAEMHQPVPRHISEHVGWRFLVHFYDTQGAIPD
jgi:hypothetical protein